MTYDDDNRWGFFLCIFNGATSSFLVDLGLQPDAARPWLLVARVKMRFPNEAGLSSLEEGPDFDNWSEQLIDAVCTTLSATYAGRITGRGIWEFYFYASANDGLREVIRTSLAAWPGYQFNHGSKLDATWSFYRDTLLPNHPKDRHQILNYAVIQKLKANGDDGTTMRPISHWLFFPDEPRWKLFEDKASREGFVTRGVNKRQQGAAARLHCEIERSETVNLTKMNAVTLLLIDFAASADGEYDGWESRLCHDRPG